MNRTTPIAIGSAIIGALLAMLGLKVFGWNSVDKTTVLDFSRETGSTVVGRSTLAGISTPAVSIPSSPRLPAPAVAFVPNTAFPTEATSGDRERLSQIAKTIIPHGRAWQAQHGDESSQTQAKVILAKKKRYDDLIESEVRSASKTINLIKQFDSLLSDSESHVQDARCGESICRVELIHENDLAALDFQPEMVLDASNGMSMETIMDRSDEDGNLKHFIYFRSPEDISDEQKRAFIEIERQSAILANGD